MKSKAADAVNITGVMAGLTLLSGPEALEGMLMVWILCVSLIAVRPKR